MSSRRLVIAIDCDDVLVHTLQPTVEDYNLRFGTRLRLSDMYRPARVDTWGTDDDEVAMARVTEYIKSNAFAQIKPYDAAIQAVAYLAKHHELHLVTGRSDFLESVTTKMLTTYFPGCFQSVEHTNYITMSTSTAKTRTKGEVCAQIGADILIDDHITHGESVIAAGVERVIVFGDYPWNQHDSLPEGMVRCIDWNETLMEIEKIANQ